MIGIPIKSSTLDGLDALLATVQMPKGIPVATVAIDGADNAGILAARCWPSLTEIAAQLDAMKEKMTQDVCTGQRRRHPKRRILIPNCVTMQGEPPSRLQDGAPAHPFKQEGRNKSNDREASRRCGVFGIYDTTGGDVAASTYFAIYALQHWGQEAAASRSTTAGSSPPIRTWAWCRMCSPGITWKGGLRPDRRGPCAVFHHRHTHPTREDSQPLVIRHVKGPWWWPTTATWSMQKS